LSTVGHNAFSWSKKASFLSSSAMVFPHNLENYRFRQLSWQSFYNPVTLIIQQGDGKTSSGSLGLRDGGMIACHVRQLSPHPEKFQLWSG
jgi:hypothetical protein